MGVRCFVCCWRVPSFGVDGMSGRIYESWKRRMLAGDENVFGMAADDFDQDTFKMERPTRSMR